MTTTGKATTARPEGQANGREPRRPRTDTPPAPSKANQVWAAMLKDGKLGKERKLKPKHLAVLMRAAMYTSGLFFESQGSIAEHVGMTRQAVAKVQNELTALGYLTLLRPRASKEGGWTKEYQLNTPFSLLPMRTMRDKSLLDSSTAIVRSEHSHCSDSEHNLKKDLKKDYGAQHAPSVSVRAPVHSDTVAADNLLPDPSPPIDTLSSSSSSPPPTREDDDDDEVVSLEGPEPTQTTERASGARRLRESEPEPIRERATPEERRAVRPMMLGGRQPIVHHGPGRPQSHAAGCGGG